MVSRLGTSLSGLPVERTAAVVLLCALTVVCLSSRPFRENVATLARITLIYMTWSRG